MNILFFGDSNTHGSDPAKGPRHSREVRFTGVLQQRLGQEYYIIEEGMGGRTTVFDDPTSPGRCGLDYLIPCLKSHMPLDLIVVMLGTNDTKDIFDASANVIGEGMKTLLDRILSVPEAFKNKVNILLVSPCIIKQGDKAFKDSPEKSKQLKPIYEQIAKQYGIYYMAASDYAQSSDLDKLHLDAIAHKNLADAFESKILEIEKNI